MPRLADAVPDTRAGRGRRPGSVLARSLVQASMPRGGRLTSSGGASIENSARERSRQATLLAELGPGPHYRGGGRTTGLGIAGNLREHHPAWIVSVIVGLLFTANILNIRADLGAMAESLRLLVPVPIWLGVLLFGSITSGGQIFLKHARTSPC